MSSAEAKPQNPTAPVASGQVSPYGAASAAGSAAASAAVVPSHSLAPSVTRDAPLPLSTAPLNGPANSPVNSPANGPTAQPLDLSDPAPLHTITHSSVRRSLVKRLADVICIPASQLTPQERHMAGDVLVELLRDADTELRRNVANRLVMLNEAPRTILLILAKDVFEVAQPILERSRSLTDSDLIHIIRNVSMQHRRVIASRRKVSDAVVDVIVEFLEEDVVNTLLSNPGANFSEKAIQRILTVSRSNPSYVNLLVKREETRPSHGLTMFWWADAAARKQILHRFAVTRNVLQETCGDLFAQASAEGWNDAAVRKALQFIERRQRNRIAIERSPYESLEQAIETAEISGMTRQLAEDISYMSGIKPATGAQIMSDKSGEALAVLCKAPGLKRDYVTRYWRALRRDGSTLEAPSAALQNVIATYDALSTDKAQTVLRYWNWSLTASLNEDVLRHIKNGVIPNESEFGAAAITAALVFGNRKTS